jgi:glycosyltransferase involved in cell wall biosynthesis
MTKVVHFLSFGIGGADRAALELVRALMLKGLDLKIAYNKMSFPIRTSDQDKDQPLLNIFEEACQIAPTFEINSVQDFERHNVDVLHTHRSGEDKWLLPGLEGLKRNFKIVETNFHGGNKTPADFRIYPSLALKEVSKIDKNQKHRVIPNIVNSRSGSSLRMELGISNNVTVFGRVGRSDKSIYSSKLLREYSKIQNDTTHLIWVGKSNLALSDAKRYGVENVTWLDPVNDPQILANIYQTFDVYLHVNALGETFGNTVAEAVIRGIPIASLKGQRGYPQAQRELLSQDQFCYSSRQFRNLVRRYSDDLTYRQEISEMNLRFGQEFLTSSVISDQIIEIYREIMK